MNKSGKLFPFCLFILLGILMLSSVQCGKEENTQTPVAEWKVFLADYESAVNEYISLVTSNSNLLSPDTKNTMLQVITNMQAKAPQIADTLSNQDLQNFLLTYGKINTRLSQTAIKQQ